MSSLMDHPVYMSVGGCVALNLKHTSSKFIRLTRIVYQTIQRLLIYLTPLKRMTFHTLLHTTVPFGMEQINSIKT